MILVQGPLGNMILSDSSGPKLPEVWANTNQEPLPGRQQYVQEWPKTSKHSTKLSCYILLVGVDLDTRCQAGRAVEQCRTSPINSEKPLEKGTLQTNTKAAAFRRSPQALLKEA